ncbi:MAG: xanthine dehydrogenase family protein molybdopterin-binding subunit [SAR324 cluster bacterium]|nr:xanthine dehydrogenase family protein molybdopterin-binding subunit [SAR324 cluster bacterium]
MEKTKIGQSVRRREDPLLIKGSGQYTSNLNLPGQLYACFLRSPFAHAEIHTIDTKEAEASSGVIAVYTNEQVREDGLGTLPVLWPVPSATEEPIFTPPHPLLAVESVKFVGDPLAMVVAETPAQALEAADLIEVDFRELPFNVNPAEALDPETPKVWQEHKDNLCVQFQAGDAAAVGAAFEKAPVVVELQVANNRLIPNVLEPRCCLADYDPETDLYTLYTPSQGVTFLKSILSEHIFKQPEQHFRVVSKDTGGGFGSRTQLYAESCLSLWAAKKLGSPVKWTGSRSEMFLTDHHARDQIFTGALALSAEGIITALKVHNTANMGAYLAALAPYIPTLGGGRVMGTIYHVPAVHLTVDCVFTNTGLVEAYRGAGRPEAAHLMERLLEKAALKLGIASDEIRRRNFIRSENLPYINFDRIAIKSGEFAATQQMALKHSDWEHFEDRRRESSIRGKLRGIGIGYYVETSGAEYEEEAQIRFEVDGTVTLIIGCYSYGQGHETVFSQILSDRLGIPIERIRYIQGDTAAVKFGGLTGGSRSSQMGGVTVHRACQAVIDKGKRVAAHLLQTDTQSVSFAEGQFAGPSMATSESGNKISLNEIARAALEPEHIPDGEEPGLDTIYRYHRGEGYNLPNGCHVCEVEIDPETGLVSVVGYTTADDCGKILNPMIVEGQIQGGIAQGLGQALLEDTHYDADSGQLLTGSLMDYCLPKASQVPSFDIFFNEVLDPANDLGVKGVGESGACGAPPAIVNAVVNALKDYGVTHLDMPLTSERVWRAIHGDVD